MEETTSFNSTIDMHIIDDKKKIQFEINRLKEWVENQHAENMDFRFTYMPGKRSSLFVIMTLGRKMKEDQPNDDVDTFDYQHHFHIAWCNNCDNGCKAYNLKITTYRKNQRNHNRLHVCHIDSMKQAEMYSLFVTRIFEFIKETAY